jgi:uncharacterized protein YqeY
MLTKENLEVDLRNAIKSRDEVRKRTLRMVLTSVKISEVDRRGPLDEPTLLGLIQKEVKSRNETIEEAKRGGREDLVASTQAEIEILLDYLPQPLTPEELESLIQEAIEEIEASGPSDMGKVMKTLMPRVQGRAEGKMVSDLVRSRLNEIQS